MLYWSQCWI